MTNRILRVVVDTNVLLSFLMKSTSKPGVFVSRVLQHHQLLLSRTTIQELEEKCNRPKFRAYFSEEEAQTLLELLSQVGETVDVDITITDCRDPKDNKFLELSIAGDADLLVTGDKDLLVLHPYQNIPVLAPHDGLLFIGVEYGQA